MGLENFWKVCYVSRNTWFKAHKPIHFGTLDTNKKDYKQILFLDLTTQSFSKTSQHQTCRAIYKEQNKINLTFF